MIICVALIIITSSLEKENVSLEWLGKASLSRRPKCKNMSRQRKKEGIPGGGIWVTISQM